MAYSYRNLILWQKAQSLALEVILLTASFPRTSANEVMARQIVRSATSIGANIAEGHGRFTPRAHAQHLSIAKGSACETDSWLDLLKRAGLISSEAEAKLHTRCDELIALLTAKIGSLSRMASSGTLRDEQAEYNTATDVLDFDEPDPDMVDDPEDGFAGLAGSRFEVLGSPLDGTDDDQPTTIRPKGLPS
jgi:four helix bundle protein